MTRTAILSGALERKTWPRGKRRAPPSFHTRAGFILVRGQQSQESGIGLDEFDLPWLQSQPVHLSTRQRTSGNQGRVAADVGVDSDRRHGPVLVCFSNAVGFDDGAFPWEARRHRPVLLRHRQVCEPTLYTAEWNEVFSNHAVEMGPSTPAFNRAVTVTTDLSFSSWLQAKAPRSYMLLFSLFG